MPPLTGRRLPLSLPRRFVCDLLHCARGVPFIPAERRMHLAEVAQARQAATPRPGWCALFIKAYARVAARRPELRRAYFSFPWPHLYEHPDSIATVAVERPVGEEEAVLFGHVRTPDRQSLTDIEGHLRRYKEQPIQDVALFRRILKVSALPRPVRRLIWWVGLHTSGPRRAKYMGTFGISVVAGLGGGLLQLRSPVTTMLNYGVLQTDGTLEVRLIFDHRVLDGGGAARALAELEAELNGAILSELRELRAAAA